MKQEEKEQLKKDILAIIKEECDGTFVSDDITEWSIASPELAPLVIVIKIFDAIDLFQNS